MRGCASKTGTGRIVMIITIRQLNPLLGASLPTFWAVRSRTLDGSFKIFYMVLQKRNALLLRSLNLLQNVLFLLLVLAQAARAPTFWFRPESWQRCAQEGGEKVSPLLELLPPSAERTLYHGFYVVSPLSSGSAVALEI